MFKILYVVAALSGNQTIESAGRWDTFNQCEAARAEAMSGDHKTIEASSSSCVLASENGYLMRGSFGGGGDPSRSVSPY
jgi:hypothetical protein